MFNRLARSRKTLQISSSSPCSNLLSCGDLNLHICFNFETLERKKVKTLDFRTFLRYNV